MLLSYFLIFILEVALICTKWNKNLSGRFGLYSDASIFKDSDCNQMKWIQAFIVEIFY